MNWYKGDIARAVAESRQKNAIFVVYVAGKDSDTDRLTSMINEEKIRSQLESDHFVAIRIESGSQAYMQFASIYQVVPVPSIFLIGLSGVPIEIGTSILQSADELDGKIKKALSSLNTTPASYSSTSLIAAERTESEKDQQQIAQSAIASDGNVSEKVDEKSKSGAATSSESRETAGSSPIVAESSEKTDHHGVVCESGVCYKNSKETASANESLEQNEKVNKEAGESEESADLNARLDATRKLLEQKRRERVEEEKLQEKERELRRRREGREMQHLQEWQREQELKELKDNIRRERLEEQAARERIRAQIAADRAERAQKFAPPMAETGTSATEKSQPVKDPATKGDKVRLQFRLPNGDAHTNTFKSSECVMSVREYVSHTLLAGIGINDFTLATTYPKYEFTANDNEKTLLDMGLFPSAVILVITKTSSNPTAIIARSGGVLNIMTTLFWTVLSPVFSVFHYLRSILPGQNRVDGSKKRSHEDTPTNNEASKRRNLDRFMTGGPSTSKETDEFKSYDNRNEQANDSKPYRRYGTSNVHRLSDKRKDSDDENATWNGNSTQQQ